MNHAAALETTFQRIRQRYAIYYHLPEGVVAADLSALALDITDRTRIRHPYAELRYRQVYLAGATRRTFVKRVPPRPPPVDASAPAADPNTTLVGRTRPVSEPRGTRVAISPVEVPPQEPAAAPASPQPEPAATPARKRRRPAISEPRGPRVASVPLPESRPDN